MRPSSSASSSASIGPRSTTARASAWRLSSALCTATEARFVPRPNLAAARPLHLPWEGPRPMTSNEPVEILLVEDNPHDVKLALYAFKTNNLANRVHVVRDGAEALEFMFCTGRYGARNMAQSPKVVLLDLKLPLVDGIEVLRQVRADPRTRTLPIVVLTSSREE